MRENLKNSMLLKILNQRGFSLVEVVIGSGLLGLVALGVMQISSQQSKLATKSTIDADITQVNAQILSYMASPGHCNANFFNKTGAATGADQNPTHIYSCPIANGSCISGTPNPALPIHTSTWDPANTKISDRVRIISIKYKVNPNTINAPALGALELTITFDLKPLRFDGTTPSKTVTKKYNTSVLLDRSTVNSGFNILGCPRSWNSTIVYGL